MNNNELTNVVGAEQKMVSVIMITYNQRSTIDQAISSVLSQKTDFDFELIIGNDASTDGTEAAVNAWSQKYPDRIKAFNREKNLGLQANFMECYKKCKGKYIAICEGDDWWSDDKKLSIQVAYMEANPQCNVCFHRVVNFYEDNRTMSLSGKCRPDMSMVELACSNVITNLSVMYRRKESMTELPAWIGGIRLFDYALHMLHAQGGTIHYLSKPMAVYRQRSKGIWSGGSRESQLLMAMDARLKIIDHLEECYARTKDIDCRQAADNMMKATDQIILSLLLVYRSEGIGSESMKWQSAEAVLKRHNPAWTSRDIDQALADRKRLESSASRSVIKPILSKIRAAVSRLMSPPVIASKVESPY